MPASYRGGHVRNVKVYNMASEMEKWQNSHLGSIFPFRLPFCGHFRPWAIFHFVPGVFVPGPSPILLWPLPSQFRINLAKVHVRIALCDRNCLQYRFSYFSGINCGVALHHLYRKTLAEIIWLYMIMTATLRLHLSCLHFVTLPLIWRYITLRLVYKSFTESKMYRVFLNPLFGESVVYTPDSRGFHHLRGFRDFSQKSFKNPCP